MQVVYMLNIEPMMVILTNLTLNSNHFVSQLVDCLL